MQLESLIIHLCCVSVWYDKSISIILHTDRNFFFYFVYCIHVPGFLCRIAVNVCADLIVAARALAFLFLFCFVVVFFPFNTS